MQSGRKDGMLAAKMGTDAGGGTGGETGSSVSDVCDIGMMPGGHAVALLSGCSYWAWELRREIQAETET